MVLLGFVGAMWVVRALDAIGLFGGHGIVPRTMYGLAGIVTAPFIHSSWQHLIANTMPLVILGALVMIQGVREFVFVTVVCALVAGFGTWLFGSFAQHVGASGIVFGYVGYLLYRPAVDGKLWSVAIAIAVGVLYSGALVTSLIPTFGVSWSGHFFGFLGGLYAARVRRRV